MWGNPEARGEMRFTSSYFRQYFTELSEVHPELPNSSFRKGQNAVISGVVQTASSRARSAEHRKPQNSNSDPGAAGQHNLNSII